MPCLRSSGLRSPGRAPALLLCGLVLVGVLASCSGAGDSGGADLETPESRPNVVLLLTDDQRLDGMAYLAETTELVGGEAGTTFTAAVSSYPLCCPARATLLTGQYAHNHGILDNVPPFGGSDLFDAIAPRSLPAALQEAGYTTSQIGKWLNGYGETSPPTALPGWDRWFTLVDPSTYQAYDYEVLDGDELVTFGRAPEDYQTDVLAAEAEAQIAELAAAEDPFFMQVAFVAPHSMNGFGAEAPGAPIPAARHLDTEVDPNTDDPALGEQDLTDKPAWLLESAQPGFSENERAFGTVHRLTGQSLLAVDEAVASIVGALDQAGVLEDTMVIFTSDNGLMLGEHQRYGKVDPYEPSIRVPLLIRGAGFPEGRESDAPVANIDLAPTIAAVTGADPMVAQDGRSLYPLAQHPELGDGRAVLIENGPSTDRLPHYEAVRVDGWLYAEYQSGERELYDLDADPAQLESLHVDSTYAEVRAQLAEVLDQLRGCEGQGCDIQASIDRP
jgi:arylsulfatase A-like enzyme